MFECSSLKQQFVGRHVDPLGHIVLILSQPVLLLLMLLNAACGEVANTNFIDLGLTWPELETTVYSSRDELSNNTTSVVL
jgi:hypothetical protein